ncbi:MAG: tetratricopeptide repeat protein [bacterium]
MSTLSRYTLIAAFLISLVYLQSLRYPFLQTWDDPEYVTLNENIRSLDMPHIRRIFTSFSMGNYAPVQILSYAVDYRLFGAGHFGFRVTNLFLHFLNSILVFLLIRKINKIEWIAAVGGLLFAIHPVQVESVAWVSQRKNLLSAFFLLLSFIFYIGSSEERNLRKYWASVVLFSIGLLAKVSIIIFPFYILACDIFVLGKRIRFKQSARYIPFVLLSVSAGLITLQAQSIGGVRAQYYGNSVLESVFVTPMLWLAYIRQILFPFNLSALYDEKVIASFSLAKAAFLAVLFVMLLFLIYWWTRKKQKIALFWLAWFIVGLLPVSHFIPMVTIMNDRYLYFPAIGIFVLMGMCFRILVQMSHPKIVKGFSAALLIGAVTVLCMVSAQRVHVWAGDFELWSDAVSRFPNQAKAGNGLGAYYMSIGENQKAIAEFKKALEINPDLYLARLNLGASYLNISNARSAVDELKKAIHIFDGDPKAHYYLGMAYYLSGMNESAIPELRWVVDRFPNWSEVTLNLIEVYQKSGKKKEADELIHSARSRFKYDIKILSELGRFADRSSY